MGKRCVGVLLAVLASCVGARDALALELRPPATQYRASSWGVASGLPHASISALFQDRDGYLWVGTYLGAARFDGVRFQSLGELAGNEEAVDLIESIAQTPDGALWFGGVYRGLLRFDPQGRLDRFGPEQGLPSATVTLVRPHPGGGLWLGTGAGLYHARFVDGHLQVQQRELEQTVWALAEDQRTGILHAGTEAGPWQRSARGWELSSRDPQVASAHVWALSFDAGGRGFAGLRGGLAELGEDGFRLSPWTAALRSPVVRAVLPDGGGLLWVATSGGGLVGFGPEPPIQFSRRQGLASDVVWDALRDREGALWAGTASGLSRVSRSLVQAFGEAEGLPQGLAWAIAPRRAGGWWLGFNSGGLIAFDGRGRIDLTGVGALPAAASAVQTVLDLGDVQWVGSVGGLFRRGADGRMQAVPAFTGMRIQSLFAPDASTLLVGTTAGLWRLRGDQVEPVQLPGAAHPAISRIRADGPGRWLIAAQEAGLFRYDGEHAERLLQLPGQRVRDALRAPNGRLWLAAVGLFALEHGRALPIEPLNRSLPVQFHALELDALGRLWASSNAGVLRVELAALDRYLAEPATPPAFMLFGEAEGMRSSECNGGTQHPLAIDADGAVWVVTTEGIVRIPADAEPARSPLPQPRIERVIVDGVARNAAAQLDLAAGPRQVAIDYTALRLADAERLRFRYRLAPTLASWSEVGARRSVAFDALAPGRYRFEVAVGTATEPWSEAVALEFSVAPHWWQRTGVRVLAVLAMLALAAAVPLMRVRALRARERALEALVRARTQELEQANAALALAASNDFLTGLPNRRAFVQALDAAFAANEPVALAMLDIDHFKAYNDAAGHVAGDQCLAEFGALLGARAASAAVRAARIGGEEFALLFVAAAVPLAGDFLDAFAASLRARAMPHPASRVSDCVTFSAGLATRRREDLRPEDLIRRADAALYRAKAEGRSRWMRADAG